jgi:RimJ/RimL family protein N-acetyltransferase
MNDKRVTATLRGPTHSPFLPEHAIEFVHTAIISLYRNKHRVWAIRDRSSAGELIGSIMIKLSDDGYPLSTSEGRNASFGFCLSPEYHRKGIMSAALKLLVYELGVKEFGIYKFVGDCFADNFASRKTFEKVGFVFDKEIKDECRKIDTGEMKDIWYLKLDI